MLNYTFEKKGISFFFLCFRFNLVVDIWEGILTSVSTCIFQAVEVFIDLFELELKFLSTQLLHSNLKANYDNYEQLN